MVLPFTLMIAIHDKAIQQRPFMMTFTPPFMIAFMIAFAAFMMAFMVAFFLVKGFDW